MPFLLFLLLILLLWTGAKRTQNNIGRHYFTYFGRFLGHTLHTIFLLLFCELMSLLAVLHTHTHTHICKARHHPFFPWSKLILLWWCWLWRNWQDFLPHTLQVACLLHVFSAVAYSHELVSKNLFFSYLFSWYNCVRAGLCACFCCCLCMLFVCTFFVNVCVASVLGFGVQVSLTHVAIQCFPLIPFSLWSVPIPYHLCHTAIVICLLTES